MELICEPVFDYGRIPATWTVADGGHRPTRRGGELTIRLQTDMALGVEGDWVRARHVLREGEQAYCALSWAEELRVPQTVDEANAAARRTTTRYWRGWLGRARIPDHRWRDPIQRSALAIKGLTYMPTGATVAALTTSLPETPGGERNWDYRYTWLRDSTFTLQALHFLDLDWEADEFMQFMADLEPNPDGGLQIMYGIDGRRDLTESTRDDLSGYAGAKPVRIGNGAFDQQQNDVFGAALDSIFLHTRRSQRHTAAAVAGRPGPGEVRDGGLARARPGDLGGARRAAALRLVEAHVLGRAGSRGEARGARRRGRPREAVACDVAGDPRGHPRPRPDRRRRPAPALRDRLARRVEPARGAVRLPARQRRAPEGQRAGDRPAT